ncbi:hypothetical protein [Nocardia bovistercoris]|uniref:Uncharacterized protein n=1 Tax=Nocardia bovistercoris TaxID=2785916 RepID=A0A931N254_9NOCA|nr:hypothetical protein [Nocardia bovistercoris]MBH0776584.1 hypothetical protein [Nocardia bovistercoris]
MSDAEVERFLSDQARGHRAADRHLFFDPATGRLIAAEHPGADAIIADQTAEDGYFTTPRPR